MEVGQFQSIAQSIKAEIQKVVVGQETLIHELLVTLFAGGNALLEGVPGLGKTLLIRTLSEVLDCSFNRIQFTPDLMPADIVGSVIITEMEDGRRGFRFEKGPIFANLILADEVNRASPRTQSALLEAMQEKRVTVSGTTYTLPQPFFVLATQNPIEMEGTYPLPEAQLDRFLYKIEVPYPAEEELIEIARRTTGAEATKVQKISNGDILLEMQAFVRQVPVAEPVYRYCARLIMLTHPTDSSPIDEVSRWVRVGASPRAMQALILAAKVEALLDNRKAVSIEDIHKVAFPVLRHRLVLSFEAQAEGYHPDNLISKIVASAPVKV
jgi:MoxR-like ATPase